MSIAVAHITVCDELGCPPCDEFVDAVRAGSSALKLPALASDSTLFATASLLPYTKFEEIDLSGLRLGFEGWQALLEACSKCLSLRVLSLKCCTLGALGHDAVQQIAQLLSRCHVGVLDVSQNGLDDTFASALARSGAATGARLAVLDLSDNAVACAGAAALAGALEGAGLHCGLRQLDLGFNSVGDGGARALAGALAATGIVSLELEGNQVGDEGACALAQAIQGAAGLRRLNLNFNALTGRGLAAVAGALLRCPGTLQELAVAGASDPGRLEGAAALLRAAAEGGCPLQLLDVRGVPLRGAGLDALCVLLAAPGSPLASLRADVAGKDGAERVAQVLPTNGTLANLMLGGPVPEHVLSFIGAALSANALARGDGPAGSPVKPPQLQPQLPAPPRGRAQGEQQRDEAPQRAATAARRGPGRLSPPLGRPASAGARSAASTLGSPGSKRGPAALDWSLTVQARSAGAADAAGMAGTHMAAGGGAEKAAEVFRRHDVDGSGYLEQQEMMAALQDLGLLEGLTARQLGRFVSTALRESDTDRDGRVSLEDFVVYFHRLARQYSDAARQGRISSRRRTPVAPLDASSDEQLKKARA